MITIKMKRTSHHPEPLPLPEYQTPQAAGLDLRAEIISSIILIPGGRAAVSTGLSIELPAGFEAQIRPRSGLAFNKGVGVVNAPGTIDADYRGEIKVMLINWGEEAVEIKRGDRIAQMIIAPVVQAQLIETTDLSSTQRGAGGFGSTGV